MSQLSEQLNAVKPFVKVTTKCRNNSEVSHNPHTISKLIGNEILCLMGFNPVGRLQYEVEGDFSEKTFYRLDYKRQDAQVVKRDSRGRQIGMPSYVPFKQLMELS